METVRKRIRLHRKQHEFRHSPARYRAFVGGRGAGKSWVGAYDLIRRMRAGGSYLIGSPTGILMQDTTYPTFKKIAQDLNVWGGVKLSPYPTATIILEDGGVEGIAEVRFRTANDPERMRGPNLLGGWLDEASLMHPDVYKIVIGSLRDGGKLGFLTATFTPKGPTHWTHEQFATGKPNTAMIRARTRENPFNHPDFEQTLFEQYGDTNFARQELGGEFVQLEGAEFPAEWFTGNDLWFDRWPEDLVLKVIALDPSKGTDGHGTDYQAHAMIGVGIEDGRYVLYVDADLQREGVIPMCERTVEICRKFAATGRMVDSVIVEDNGTMGFVPQAFDAACVKLKYLIPFMCRPSMDRKENRIRQQVAPPLSRRQLRFKRTPGARLVMGQLQSFPFDEHDDGPDALSTGLKRVAELIAGTG